MSKTQKTIDEYLYRGYQLWKRAAKELVLEANKLEPKKFLDWFEKLLPKLMPASRRYYIASSREFLIALQKKNDREALFDSNLQIEISRIMAMQSSHFSETGEDVPRGRTSNQKAKKLKVDEMKKMKENSEKIRGKWVKKSIAWMEANLLVGLRPSEWRSAKIGNLNGKLVLEVKNGKNSNQRANGQYRHLDISEFSLEQLKVIKKQIKIAARFSGSDEEWHVFYEGVRKTIHKLTRLTFKNRTKYPSLYSSRHQFCADAKSSGLNLVEIAALMGHATDETATFHYGKKRYGSSGFKVKPSEIETQTVRLKAINRMNRGNARPRI